MRGGFRVGVGAGWSLGGIHMLACEGRDAGTSQRKFVD